MSRNVFLFTILIILLVTGCGRLSTPEPLRTPMPEKASATDLPALGDVWTIQMTHSGGIMGLSRLIEISSDGIFTVVDNRANKVIEGELSAAELSNINELISSSKYISPSKPDGMACADCFIYDLEIQAGGEKFATQLNDISLPNSGLESLVTHLRGLIDTALK